MNLNLHRSHEVGRIINNQGAAYRIVRETGVRLDMFPGGGGVREVECEKVADKVLTLGEIRQLR